MQLRFKSIYGFGGYVYDTPSGDVYSITARNPHKMKWYSDSRGRKYVRLTRRTNPGQHVVVTVYVNALLEMLDTPNQTTEKEHKMNQTTPNTRFMIATVRANGSYGFAAEPAMHRSLAEAETEAARLASINPGKRFAVVATVSSVVSGGLVWSR